ncbi:hypothetical protein [Bradyrhizobium cenepequi]|uniref:hypothetical protein n=1 Tax=Bradyrhizobium cenepequi TaxID=2821403 RepID=UPI001CE2F72C|nr:hypothetical protein [Bradyrhizobium cenepequi]MCA6112796.1 hypothetical protein [Bradyrhizobium cenepequi]
MMLKRRLMICGAAVALSTGVAAPAAAEPWVRGYVVNTYAYAFRYGGRPGFTRGSEIEPGVDCPHGRSSHFTTDAQLRIALGRQKWRSQQEIDWIIAPPGLDQVRERQGLRFDILSRAVSYRAYKRGIATYVNPWAAEDPGQPEVTSRIGEGFNLDGKVGARDFVSPAGEMGIDNALYRAWGCDAPWRGDGNAEFDLRVRDSMRFGLFTMVLRISGNQDPMNDSDAIVEIGYSPDKIVKDARGGIAADYSYRILKNAQYTKLRAKIINGVVETEQVEHLHAPRIAWVFSQNGDANFSKGKIRLKIAPDGLSGTGLIGGYRNWRDLYAEASLWNNAGQQDIGRHQDHVALYFALRRNADGMYEEKSGKYNGISTAYRITMSAAFVVEADEPMNIPIHAYDLWRKKAFEAIKANTIRGIETRIPQDVPPGNFEAVYPRLERTIKDLPSKDFFLKTLDRPHYPDGVGMDEAGNLIDDQGNCIDKTVVCGPP